MDSLNHHDVVIDVGAHIGVASLLFARRGSRVVAIEPNDSAYRELQKWAACHPKVETIRGAAVAGHQQHVPLYLHRDFERDPTHYAQGCSLLADKPNVGVASQMVPTIDLVQLLRSLGSVAVLKVDIEGYEVELLPWLTDQGALSQVSHVFVETHERKWPNLVRPTLEMKAKCEDERGECQFHWNWP